MDSLLRLLLALALFLGFPAGPTILAYGLVGPAPVEEREERVAEHGAAKETVEVQERTPRRPDPTPTAARDLRSARLEAPRAKCPGASSLPLGLTTTRLRC